MKIINNNLKYFNLMLELFRSRKNTKYSQERLDEIEEFLCDEMDFAWKTTTKQEDDLIDYIIALENIHLFDRIQKEWIIGRADKL